MLREQTPMRRAAGSGKWVVGLAVVLAASPTTARAQYPAEPPAPTALRPVRFPAFVNARLSNGVDVIIVEHHEQPVVTVSLSMPAGSFYEPPDRAGLADLVADLITKGTGSRSAEQIAEEVEGAGGAIGASASNDFLTVTMSALSENLPRAMAVLADVVTGSTFPEREVELSRTRALSAIQLELSQPSAIGQRIFRREVYGAHPYGSSATTATLRAVTRDDVVRFYAERVRPAGALLVIAGDVNPGAARRLAEQALSTWRGGPAPAAAAPAIPERQGSEIVLVHKGGAVQSNMLAGFPFITPRDPAFYALALMNRILGGGADSRLFLILREQKGWTYGAYSGFSRPRGMGNFAATAEVRTEVTDSALGELIRQLERMRAEAPPDSEIQAAKNYLVGRFPLTIETPEEIAGAVASARLLGLPGDYVQRYRERLSAVTPAQLAAAARRHLTTDRMVVVVVGDGPRILGGLKSLGPPVRIVDVEGRPLTEEDLLPRAGAVAWRPERIVPGTYRYRVLVQGNPFGEEVREVARASEAGRDAWRVTTSTTIGPIMRQADTTTFDASTLAPIRVRQSGAVQGQETFVRLDYEGQRVRGQSRAPRPGAAPSERSIDTTLAEGTLDDNQFGAIMSALPYAAGARWTLPAFSGGEAAVKTFTASVAGEDSVAVPAGTFACWRVEIQGGQVPVTMFVAKDSPHMVVKIELVGAPLVFELTERR